MKKRIGSFLLLLMMVFAFIAPVIATATATEEVYAATTKAQMLAQAKKTKSDTKYVIVFSYSAKRITVYDKNDGYKVVATGQAVGAKSDKRGTVPKQYYLNGNKKYDRNPNNKDHYDSKGRPWYHEYYVCYYNTSKKAGTGYNAIHTVLYAYGSSVRYYNNTAKKIQNADNVFGNHWSAGCTRASNSVAHFIYDHCGKGTGYYIMK